MKFTVDTKAKVITLIDRVTFKEMDSLKKFIVDNWREWSVEALKVTEVQKEYINQWWLQWPYSYPYNPYQPVIYNIGNIDTPTVVRPSVTYMASPDKSQFVVDANGAIADFTLTHMLNEVQ